MKNIVKVEPAAIPDTLTQGGGDARGRPASLISARFLQGHCHPIGFSWLRSCIEPLPDRKRFGSLTARCSADSNPPGPWNSQPRLAGKSFGKLYSQPHNPQRQARQKLRLAQRLTRSIVLLPA